MPISSLSRRVAGLECRQPSDTQIDADAASFTRRMLPLAQRMAQSVRPTNHDSPAVRLACALTFGSPDERAERLAHAATKVGATVPIVPIVPGGASA